MVYSVAIIVTDEYPEEVIQVLQQLADNFKLMPEQLILCVNDSHHQRMWQGLVLNDRLKQLYRQFNRPAVKLHKQDIVCLLAQNNATTSTHSQNSPLARCYTRLHRLYQQLSGAEKPDINNTPYSSCRFIHVIATRCGFTSSATAQMASYFSSYNDVLLFLNKTRRPNSGKTNLALQTINRASNNARLNDELPKVVLSIPRRRLWCAGVEVPMSTANLAFYLMMLKDVQQQHHGYECPSRNSDGSPELAVKYLQALLRLGGKNVEFRHLHQALTYCEEHEFSLREDVISGLYQGLKYSAFNARKNEISRSLMRVLPPSIAAQFKIVPVSQSRRAGARRLVSHWGLSLNASMIQILE